MLASFALTRWRAVAGLRLTNLLLVAIATLFGCLLDALASGYATALAVGIESGAARFIILVMVSLAATVAIPVIERIGFVGLIFPHVMRGYIGYFHRSLIPVTAAVAAWADDGSHYFCPHRITYRSHN